MDFTLTPEQAEFTASVRRLVSATTELPRDGFDADSYAAAWHAFAELGLAGLCIDEARGGFSGAAEDIALVGFELGRAPVTAPRLETMVLAGHLLGAGEGAAVQGWRDRFVAGDLSVAVAAAERDDPIGFGVPQTTATHGDYGYRLSGSKVAVIGGGTAECLLVTARMPSGSLGLFVLDPATPGVERSSYRLVDTTPVADIVFRAVAVAPDGLIAQGAAAQTLAGEAFDLAIVAQCAAEVGGMERAIELCVEHMKTRQQFGRPLSEFQALQHRVADMFITANAARSSVYAAIHATYGPAETRGAAAARCKLTVSNASVAVIGDAVHVHGGIGITTEYLVGHLYRRAIVDGQLLGNAAHHLARLVDRPARRGPAEVVSLAAAVA